MEDNLNSPSVSLSTTSRNDHYEPIISDISCDLHVQIQDAIWGCERGLQKLTSKFISGLPSQNRGIFKVHQSIELVDVRENICDIALKVTVISKKISFVKEEKTGY